MGPHDERETIGTDGAGPTTREEPKPLHGLGQAGEGGRVQGRRDTLPLNRHRRGIAVRVLAPGAAAWLSAAAATSVDAPPVQPLPGNKPCPYPPIAQKMLVAGPVAAAAEVRPDGTVASVEVPQVPMPHVGFEETVRDCISAWRFPPAAEGETSSRRYEARLRFRINADAEAAIRARLESFAAAWNAGDMTAVEALAARPPQPPKGAHAVPPLRAQLAGEVGSSTRRIELQPEVHGIQFMGADFASVRQDFRWAPHAAPGPDDHAEEAIGGLVEIYAEREPSSLEAFLERGAGGWRLVRVRGLRPMSGVAVPSGKPLSVAEGIREPRKVKDFKPQYPDLAKSQGIQGPVVLECVLSPEGKVTDIALLYGPDKRLAEAAVRAVRRWEYTPTLLLGQPVPVIMTITVNFRLSF
jgi:TonB family protein